MTEPTTDDAAIRRLCYYLARAGMAVSAEDRPPSYAEAVRAVRPLLRPELRAAFDERATDQAPAAGMVAGIAAFTAALRG